MNTTVQEFHPFPRNRRTASLRRFHFKLNPYVSQTGYYVVEEH